MTSFLILLWLSVLCAGSTLPKVYSSSNVADVATNGAQPGEAGYYLLADVETVPHVGPTDELKRTQRSFWKRLLKGTGLPDLFGEEECDDCCRNNYNYNTGNGDSYGLPLTPPQPFNPYYMPLPPPLRPLRVLEPFFNRPRGGLYGGFGGNSRPGYQGIGGNNYGRIEEKLGGYGANSKSDYEGTNQDVYEEKSGDNENEYQNNIESGGDSNSASEYSNDGNDDSYVDGNSGGNKADTSNYGAKSDYSSGGDTASGGNSYSNAAYDGSTSTGGNQPQILYQPIIYVSPQYLPLTGDYESSKKSDSNAAAEVNSASGDAESAYELPSEPETPVEEVQYESPESNDEEPAEPEAVETPVYKEPAAPAYSPPIAPVAPCSTCSPCGWPPYGIPFPVIPLYSPCQGCGGGYASMPAPKGHGSPYSSVQQSAYTSASPAAPSQNPYSSQGGYSSDSSPSSNYGSEANNAASDSSGVYGSDDSSSPNEYSGNSESSGTGDGAPTASYSSNDASGSSSSYGEKNSADAYESTGNGYGSSANESPSSAGYSQSTSNVESGSNDYSNNSPSYGGDSSAIGNGNGGSSSYAASSGNAAGYGHSQSSGYSNSSPSYSGGNTDSGYGGKTPLSLYSGNSIGYGSGSSSGYGAPLYAGHSVGYGSHPSSGYSPSGYGNSANYRPHGQPIHLNIIPSYGEHNTAPSYGEGGGHVMPGLTTVSTVYTIVAPQSGSSYGQPTRLYGSGPIYQPPHYGYQPIPKVYHPRPQMTAIQFTLPNQSCRQYSGLYDSHHSPYAY